MVVIDAVRASNSALGSSLPGISAVFVGGTSGIGRSTLTQLARHAQQPKVFIVGRSASRAAPLLSELRHINPGGAFDFIEADVSLVSNVDRACREVNSHLKTLDFLFMTPGGISLSGRTDTTEGIDHLFALRYYSRMRFIQQLLPALQSSSLARIVSVLGGGFEGPINKDDLDLKRTHSVLNCALHSVTMTTLAMDHLASSTGSRSSFIHTFPSIVGTNIYSNSFPAPMAALYNYGIWPLMAPFSVGVEESGERNLYHATSARFPSCGGTGRQGVELGDGIKPAVGLNGEPGGGVYLTNWKGEVSAAGKVVQKYRGERLPENIWQHTVDVLEKAVQ